MARLATRTAKPDGQCYIPPERVCLGKFFMFISLCVCLNVIIFKCLKPGILAALNFLLLIKKQPYYFVGFHTFLCFPFFFAVSLVAVMSLVDYHIFGSHLSLIEQFSLSV